VGHYTKLQFVKQNDDELFNKMEHTVQSGPFVETFKNHIRFYDPNVNPVGELH